METVLDAREKLRSTIDLIAELEGTDFPHPDSSDALKLIRQLIEKSLQDLISLDSDAADRVLLSYCIQATSDISDALELLGFVVNSTSIRNSFEVHQCLLDISNKLISRDARLLLSFEWDYVPFTYPLNVPNLPNFVVIGLPASEANNALIIPAAGHELGHSLWRHCDLESEYTLPLQEKIKEIIVNRYWEKFEKFNKPTVQKPDDLDDMFTKVLWKKAHVWGLSQSEELFCDIVGLIIFGTSYLHTFAYLLAPQLGENRSESYPGIKIRSRFLEHSANKLGIRVPPDFVDRFTEQREPYEPAQYSFLLLRLADGAVDSIFDQILETATRLCKQRGFAPPSEAGWKHVTKAFYSHVPASGSGTLTNIINAGWEVCRNQKFMDVLDTQERRGVAKLNELLLKSIEVLEIETLLQEQSRDIKAGEDTGSAQG